MLSLYAGHVCMAGPSFLGGIPGRRNAARARCGGRPCDPVGRRVDRLGAGRLGLLFDLVADAADLDAGEVRPVTGRIGGHRFERFVWPPGPAPAGPRGDPAGRRVLGQALALDRWRESAVSMANSMAL
jgi:hypothetical protein